MSQEGTIAVVGDPDQAKWDFAELQRALDGAGTLLDVDKTTAPWWEIWLQATVEVLTDGLVSDDTLEALTGINASSLVLRTVEFIGAINRPVLVKRIQGYAAAILSEEEYRAVVIVPQIEFDFKLAGMTADPDLVEVVERYRDLVIAGEYLEPGEGLDPSVLLLYAALDHRPMYRDRMNAYVTGLIEPAVIDPPVAELEPAPGAASGLPTSLLDPPPAV